MRILLASGGFRTEERIANLRRHLVVHFGPIARVLFIPYALQDHDKYVQLLSERGHNAGYELVGIHRCSNPREAVQNADAIYIGGGNTFRLLDALYRFDLLDVICERVRAGVPYVGISAGSNVACPTIQTTNDMPIVQPPSFAALARIFHRALMAAAFSRLGPGGSDQWIAGGADAHTTPFPPSDFCFAVTSNGIVGKLWTEDR
jgi:dipeptidase E